MAKHGYNDRKVLTVDEINAMFRAMEEADFGPEIEIETVNEVMEDEYDVMESWNHYPEPDVNDGQPSEYDEWQDVYGGDDWDHGQYDSEDFFDGGIDF